MRATVVLNIKSWLSKIHPPLPRSARDSHKLLNVLTTSFQKQLDEAHPPIESRGHPPKASLSKTNQTLTRSTAIDSLIAGSSSSSQQSDPGKLANTWTSLSHAIRHGAGDLETIIRLSTSVFPTGPNESGHYPPIVFDKMISTWFQNADLQTRTAVLQDQRILKAVRRLLPGMQYPRVMWDELERYIMDSPAEVTIDEAKAIKCCATFNLMSTIGLDMNESASRFKRILAIFEERAYREQTLDWISHDSKTAFHPLGKPARWLVSFIISHPHSHGLDASHFETLLNNVRLWDSPLLLWKEMIKAFHPNRQDSSGVIRALSDPESRSAYSLRLKMMPSAKPAPTTPLVYLSQTLQEKGRYDDAEIIESFVRSHLNGEDVSILPSYQQNEHPTQHHILAPT